MSVFSNFREAHEILNIEDPINTYISGNEITGVSSIRIISNPYSLNCFSNNGDIINIVGKGKQKIQGYPILNQNILEQRPFYKSMISQNTFPVLHKNSTNDVYLLGYYTVINIEKNTTWSGFTYFKIILFKQY
jgi:hypothetical protein